MLNTAGLRVCISSVKFLVIVLPATFEEEEIVILLEENQELVAKELFC